MALEASASSCRKGLRGGSYPCHLVHTAPGLDYTHFFFFPSNAMDVLNQTFPRGCMNLTDGFHGQGGVQAAETEERAEPLAPPLCKLGLQ